MIIIHPVVSEFRADESKLRHYQFVVGPVAQTWKKNLEKISLSKKLEHLLLFKQKVMNNENSCQF